MTSAGPCGLRWPSRSSSPSRSGCPGPADSRWWAITNQVQGDFREQIGWPELVQEVAKIRDSLTPEERAHLGILGTNYGELAPSTCTAEVRPAARHQRRQFVLDRGYGDPPPQTLIVWASAGSASTITSNPAALPAIPGTSTASRTRRPKTIPNIRVCGPPKQGLAGVLEKLSLLRVTV